MMMLLIIIRNRNRS
ncbi:hypothetical protein BLA29_009501 [Euroglyphus maynei]|uniref:Uncharacterized protein n=1 Tax=Euroglyphus maynei TaxID=6958 RepID=A0A1Y3BPM3_EURMA|nr:hypothetical protein BLA29_009501 [Euroglyphus maynei]